MTKNTQITLDAKDILVAMAMAFSPNMGGWRYQTMAELLGLSQSQVHASVGRLVRSGLLNGRDLKGKVNREALAEFIIHGVRYLFPATLTGMVRGIPTGPTSDLFESSLVALDSESPAMVWADAKGASRGVGLVPIHPCVTKAVLREPALYKALVHLDALRIGNSRERDFAAEFFRRELRWTS